MQMAHEPLIVFVHVPKTAGSTVNKVLKHFSYRGHEHCEQLAGSQISKVALDSDWLSGHISKDLFSTYLSELRREAEYFSAVRDPPSQIMSHINHILLHLYRKVSPGDQPFEIELRSLDFSNTQSVISYLYRYADIFLNFQSRLIIGKDFDAISEAESASRLNAYSFIATEQTLPSLYRSFGFPNIRNKLHDFRENIANDYYFDKKEFQKSEIHEFLVEHNRHDIRLYDEVGRKCWPAERRRPFRSARFRCQILTPDTFDEECYLDANPDVAHAVRVGQMKSGRDHYVQFGHAEIRFTRVPTLGGRIRLIGRRAVKLLRQQLKRVRIGF